MPEPIQIAEVQVKPGERRRIELPVSRMATETWMTIPVEIVHGRRSGPRMWISGAMHGDELNGVEIVRQILNRVDPDELRGTLFAIPIVNVFGFINQSRYLPDRRDLNRSFPGASRGSLASRMAHLLMSEIVSQCTHGIDLHTGSNFRENLPQIRGNLKDPETRSCAEAFAAPVMMHSETRDGSLREAATCQGVSVLLYEAGEPLRFHEASIRNGVDGILRVMARLKMRSRSPRRTRHESIEVRDSRWLRARRGGIIRLDVQLGEFVEKGDRLGVVADAFGDNPLSVKAPSRGIVIGLTNNPYVHQGDGVVHLGGQV